MNEPTETQILNRNKLLEKAKERLVEKEVEYLEGLADLDVKLVVDKMRSAVIEQGKLVDLHQRTLEEHQILVRQATTKAKQAIDEADLLREELITVKNKLDENNQLVGKITELIETEIYNSFWYKFKTFFCKFKRSK